MTPSNIIGDGDNAPGYVVGHNGGGTCSNRLLNFSADTIKNWTSTVIRDYLDIHFEKVQAILN